MSYILNTQLEKIQFFFQVQKIIGYTCLFPLGKLQNFKTFKNLVLSTSPPQVSTDIYKTSDSWSSLNL